MENALRRTGWRVLLAGRSVAAKRVRTASGPLRPRFHWYNTTWRNERQVELPLAFGFVGRTPPGALLEVGNVLSHYGRVGHTVVDLYERSAGVLNVDVVDFQPGRRFDRILSVSTLEHVGWDEPVRDPAKFGRAVRHLSSLLSPGGRLLFTVPVGYNPSVDAFLQALPHGYDAEFLEWDGPGSAWRSSPTMPAGKTYDATVPTAKAIAVVRHTAAAAPQ